MTDIEPASALAERIMSEAYVRHYSEETGDFVEYKMADVLAHIEADRAAVREQALREAIEATREAMRREGATYDRVIASGISSGYESELISNMRHEKNIAGHAYADVELALEQLKRGDRSVLTLATTETP